MPLLPNPVIWKEQIALFGQEELSVFNKFIEIYN